MRQIDFISNRDKQRLKMLVRDLQEILDGKTYPHVVNGKVLDQVDLYLKVLGYK